MSEFKLDLTKLNDSNYFSWEFKIRVILEKDDLLKFITDEPPNEIDVNWKKSDAKARSIILFSIDDGQLIHCREAKTCYDLWNTLKSHHQKSSLFSKVIFLKKICKLKFNEGEKINDHINKMDELFHQLNIMGENFNDNLKIAFMLSSLPDSYDTVVMSLETRSEKDLTYKIVVNRLIEEYDRRKNKDLDGFSEEKAFRVSKYNKKKCAHCFKIGHLKSECFILNPNLKKEKAFKERGSKSHDKGKQSINLASESNNENEQKEVLFCMISDSPDKWYIDSAATSHMSCDRDFFCELYPCDEKIYVANGEIMRARQKGYGYLNCVCPNLKTFKIRLSNVFYLPNLESNLVSVKKLAEKNCRVNFSGDMCHLIFDNEIIATAKLNGTLYQLNCNIEMAHMSKEKICTSDLVTWHSRLGHRNIESIKNMIRNEMVSDIQISNNRFEGKCETCIKGKLFKKPFGKNFEIKTKKLS